MADIFVCCVLLAIIHFIYMIFSSPLSLSLPRSLAPSLPLFLSVFPSLFLGARRPEKVVVAPRRAMAAGSQSGGGGGV